MSAVPVVAIEAAAYYLPSKVVSIEDWAAITGRPAGLVETLKQNQVLRYHDAEGQSPEDMISEAVAQLAAQTDLRAPEVDLIIYVHTMPLSAPPAPRSIFGALFARFNFQRAVCFSVAQQNCVSFLASLRIIRAMMTADPTLKRVLIVGGDSLPFASQRTIEDNGVHSDGAAAALVLRDGQRNRLVSIETKMDGRFFRGVLNDEEVEHNQRYYWTMISVIRSAIRKSGRTVGGISRILPHNLNLPGWKKVLGVLEIDESRLFASNIPSKGHVFSCDGMINLADCETLNAGEHYAVYSNGFSGCFGCGVFER